MAIAMQYHQKHSGLAFFDEVVNEDEFLEFLIEWSDSIVPPENMGLSNAAAISHKRKLEELSNVASFSSSLFQLHPSIRQNSDVNSQLAKLPILLFEAFNGGDLQYIRDKISETMTPACTLQTMLLEKPLFGRHNYYNFLHSLSVSHPDMVFVLKNVRLCTLPDGSRCIKFKYFFTGTNAFPSAAESYYYDKKEYFEKYLDRSKFNEKEVASMNSLVAHHKTYGTPYVCFGRGSAIFNLNDENKVSSTFFEWKLTSICSPIVERNITK